MKKDLTKAKNYPIIERCQYRRQYEPYSWCDLSDNICLEDSGNSLFDQECENNTTKEEE